MRRVLWLTNKFTNYSSVFIERDATAEEKQRTDKIDLFGDTIDQQISSLANVVSSYNITNIQTEKDHLIFEVPLNQLLKQNYNYGETVKLEEIT